MTTLQRDRGSVALLTGKGGGEPVGVKHQLKLPLAPSLEKRRLQAHLMLMLIDGLVIVGASLLVSLLYIGRAYDAQTLQQINLFLPLYWGAALMTRTYSIQALTSLRYSQSRSMVMMPTALMLMVFIAFFTKSSDPFSRVSTIASVVVIAGSIPWTRTLSQPFVRSCCRPTAQNELAIDSALAGPGRSAVTGRFLDALMPYALSGPA